MRRAALVAIGLLATEGQCTGGRPLSFGTRPWCNVRAVTSNAQPAFAWHANEFHCGGCLSGCGRTRELAARAPCRAGCYRPTCYGRAVHRREASLLRYKTVVQRESCDLQRAAGIRVARERVPLRWLSLRMWQNTRACRARAVPRWLRSAYALLKGSAPVEGLSLSVQHRGTTCELWPPTGSRRSRGRCASATALAVFRKVA